MKPLCAIFSMAGYGLAEKISKQLGYPLRHIEPKGKNIKLPVNMNEKWVFFIQNLNNPEDLYNLALALYASRRAGAIKRIAVVPYLGYTQQAGQIREAVPSRVVADILHINGLTSMITVDVRTRKISSAYTCEVKMAYADEAALQALKEYIFEEERSLDMDNFVAVAPDIDKIERVKKIAMSKWGFAAIEKKAGSENDWSEIKYKEGIDTLQGKNCLIFDDSARTGDTICTAADALSKMGTAAIIACVTHIEANKEMIARIADSKIDILLVSDSLGLSRLDMAILESKGKKAIVFSLAKLLAKSMRETWMVL